MEDGIGEIDFNELVLMNEQSLNNSGEEMTITLEDLTTSGEEKKEEEVVTEITPPVVEKKEESVEVKTEDITSKAEDYSSIAKSLLEKGDWEDGIIDIDGVEVKLSEMENLDKDTFLEIWEEQKKAAKESLNKDFIPVKGADENKKRLINIIMSGADLKQIFENEAQLKRPYEGVDLDNQQTLQSIYYNQLLRQNIDESDAKDLVLKATKDLSLDVKAKKIVDAYQKNYDDNLQKLEQDTLEAAKKEQESIKIYKKNLSELYKEEGIDETLSKTLIEAGTKIDKSGALYIDTVYEQIMEDPEKAKDLIFFMLEKEKFLANKGAKIKTKVEIDNLKKFKLVRDTSKSTNKQAEEEVKETSAFGNIVLT